MDYIDVRIIPSLEVRKIIREEGPWSKKKKLVLEVKELRNSLKRAGFKVKSVTPCRESQLL